MRVTIAVVGTFDTKSEELNFLADQIRKQGIQVITINTGTRYSEAVTDVTNQAVAEAAGYTLQQIEHAGRGEALDMIMDGIQKLITRMYQDGKIQGIISMGGSAGTMVGSAAMKNLPIGFPKVIVSTIATGGNIGKFFADKDICIMNSVVDISGINYISRRIFQEAAGMIAGGARAAAETKTGEEKPIITATMFGVTTPCVNTAKIWLEKRGYQVIVFHATGSGGRAMENMIREGKVAGVLDITTTEWADNVCGGIAAAGPERLSAVAEMGIPQVVSVGAVDMAGFFEKETVPEKYQERNLYYHNAHATLMRTNQEENKEIGTCMAYQLNKCISSCSLMLPLQGISAMDKEGKQLYGPEEDQELFRTLRQNIHNPKVEILELDCHINDETFAIAAARKLDQLIREKE